MTYEDFVRQGNLAVRNYPCEDGDYLARLFIERQVTPEQFCKNVKGWFILWLGVSEKESEELLNFVRCAVLSASFAPLSKGNTGLTMMC
jgi:hypothetical protein